MFASRSCRKSVMIGTSLNAAEMKKVWTSVVTSRTIHLEFVFCVYNFLSSVN